jgi:uncharacterized protein (TIGR02284 family)
MDKNRAIEILNNLIETCRDGEQGFREAAENVTGGDLRVFFNEASRRRSDLVDELQQHVRAMGGDPERTGSATGAVHRAWIGIKGTLTGKDDKSILEEVERGEDSAVKAYENALQEGLPVTVRPIVERQYSEIKSVHDRAKQMRDKNAAGAGRR